MKEKSCCFTGHRKINDDELGNLTQSLMRVIDVQIAKGFDTFYTGGALGFDTLAALAVLQAKEEHAHIKLKLVLPCENQTNFWNCTDINMYKKIIEKSDGCIYTDEVYKRNSMHKRNRYLVDSSSLCIAYLNRETGGTAFTVRYAKRKGCAVINIADCEL